MVSATQFTPVSLVATVQNYEWGLKGDKSLVAALYEKNSDAEIDQERPYAEVSSPPLLSYLLFSCGWVLMLVARARLLAPMSL